MKLYESQRIAVSDFLKGVNTHEETFLSDQLKDRVFDGLWLVGRIGRLRQ